MAGTAAAEEWRQGWRIVSAATACMSVGVIPTYALGVFMSPLSDEFGWTKTQIALSISIASIISALMAPIVGRVIDRLGARRVGLVGIIAGALTYAMFTLVTSNIALWWAISIVQAVAASFASPMLWSLGVAGRFSERRGMALAIALTGTNLIGAITPPLTLGLIQHFGWRGGYLGLAVTMAVLSFPLAYFYFFDARHLTLRKGASAKSDAKAPAEMILMGFTYAEAVRQVRFWTLAISVSLAGVGVVGVVTHLVPLLVGRGLLPLEAASIAGAMALIAAVGRLGTGMLVDRMFVPPLAAALLAFAMLASIWLAGDGDIGFWGALVAVAGIGLAQGTELSLVSYLAARYFGMRSYGAIYGVLFGAYAFGCFAGPIAMGAAFDILGSYELALKGVAAAFGMSAVLLLFLGRYPNFSLQAEADGDPSGEEPAAKVLAPPRLGAA